MPTHKPSHGRWPTPMVDPDPDDLALADDIIADLRAADRKGQLGNRAVGKDQKRNVGLTVKAFAGWLAARDVRLFDASRRDCAEWFAARAELVAPNTQVSNWVHLRSFYRNAEADVAEPLAGRTSPMARIPQPDAPKLVRTKAARGDEYDALIAVFDKRTFHGLRDAAIVSLMWRSGVRVGELAQIDLDDLDLDARRILLEETKNDEQRRPPLHPDTIRLLRRYLRRRGDRPGPLFVNTGPRRKSDRLKTSSIQTMFKRAVDRAGIRITPHALRRGWYAEFMTHGGDVVAAMHIAGWKREVMPLRYGADRLDEISQAVFDEVAQRQVQAGRRRSRPLRAV
jgi:integrase